jgi:peptidoglycan DL-endopeptidase CwlO
VTARPALLVAPRDTRECPGPISEATLHRPSPSRALAAGAIALAVIAPALDPAEQAAEAVTAAPPTSGDVAGSTVADPQAAYQARSVMAERASRGSARQAPGERPDANRMPQRPMMSRVAERASRAATLAASRESHTLHAEAVNAEAVEAEAVKVARAAKTARAAGLRGTESAPRSRAVRMREAHRATAHRRSVVVRHATVNHSERVVRLRGGMTAVIDYARSQVGKRYVSGGEGPGGFDCSGFTKRAYARAGIALPHSSGAQAARARTIARSQARPGDLVVGPGHVGIYMGNGMMIDAGNHRTGVIYRKLYSGLRVERF